MSKIRDSRYENSGRSVIKITIVTLKFVITKVTQEKVL